MGRYNLRFRRSIGLGKLFRLNFGKRGMSVSTGVPGARRTWHSSGRRTTTFGLPGSGISWQKVDQPSRASTPTTPPRSPHGDKKGSFPAHPESLSPAEPSDLELLLRANQEMRDGRRVQ